MDKKRCVSVLVLLALLFVASPAPASKFPERPIEIIVGWGAGGGTDIFARAIARSASKILGQPIAVRNMPGASATIGADYVARQPADGYTVWAMTSSDLPSNVANGINPHPIASYTAIARIHNDVGMLQVLPKRFANINEVVEFARKKPLRVGGSDVRGQNEVMVAAWANLAGINVTYVTYERAGDMHAALLGGHLDVIFEELGPVAGLVAAGTVRPVLVFTDKRIKGFPDAPLAVEKGWNLTRTQWRGLMVRSGTPPEIVEILRNAFEQAIQDPKYIAFEQERFLVPAYLRGDAFMRLINDDVDFYRTILRKLGHIK